MTKNYTKLKNILEREFKYSNEVREKINIMENLLVHVKVGSLIVSTALSGIKSIYKILLHQHSLAINATSGELSDQERELLNHQFANDAQNIDSIAYMTNYRGFSLLDGSLYSNSKLTTKVSDNSVAASSVLNFNNVTMKEGDTINIAGVTFQAIDWNSTSNFIKEKATSIILYDPNKYRIDYLDAIYNVIMSTLHSFDPSDVADKNKLSGLNMIFDRTNKKISIECKNAGTICNDLTVGAQIVSGQPNDITLNGLDIIGTKAKFYKEGNNYNKFGAKPGFNGDLYAGKLSSSGNAYNGSETTITKGFVSDAILTSIDETNEDNTGVNTSGISNNAAFVGKILGFNANFVKEGYVDMSITVGDYSYFANYINTALEDRQIIRFSSICKEGGYFDLQFESAFNSGSSPVQDQSDANAFADLLNIAFAGLEFYQKRALEYNPVGAIYSEGEDTIPCGDLAGSNFELIHSNFEKLEIEDIEVREPSNFISSATIKITISGETYVSGYDKSGAPKRLGNYIFSGESIGLVSMQDPSHILIFTNGNKRGLDLSTSDDAKAFENALSNAFGYDSSNGIEIMNDEKYYIALQIPGVKTIDLYDYKLLNDQGLDISKQGNALAVTTVVENASNKVLHIIEDLKSYLLELNLSEASVKSNLEILNPQQYHDVFGENVFCKFTGQIAESSNYQS